ncbi:MAG: hypothetical protein ACTSWW_02185 [Promethearchaeota archaeon]
MKKNFNNQKLLQDQEKESKWKVRYEIPFIDRVGEDEATLQENFYKTSLIVLLVGCLVSLGSSLIMFPPFEPNFSSFWWGIRIAGFIAGIIASQMWAKRGDNQSALIAHLIRKFCGTQMFTAILIFAFYDLVGLEPVYQFVNLLFYSNASLFAAILVKKSFEAQDSKSFGIVMGLGVILGTMALLLLWFGFDPVIFLISAGYLSVLGLVDTTAIKDSAMYNREDAWMSGVLGVWWWNAFIVLRFGRVIGYLIYIVIMLIAHK